MTITATLAATKSSRVNSFAFTPSTSTPGAGVLCIDSKRSACEYFVLPLDADTGRAFTLAKIDPGSDPSESHYSCLIAADGRTECDCRGHTAHGHCRHTAALAALIEAGTL